MVCFAEVAESFPICLGRRVRVALHVDGFPDIVREYGPDNSVDLVVALSTAIRFGDNFTVTFLGDEAEAE